MKDSLHILSEVLYQDNGWDIKNSWDVDAGCPLIQWFSTFLHLWTYSWKLLNLATPWVNFPTVCFVTELKLMPLKCQTYLWELKQHLGHMRVAKKLLHCSPFSFCFSVWLLISCNIAYYLSTSKLILISS